MTQPPPSGNAGSNPERDLMAFGELSYGELCGSSGDQGLGWSLWSNASTSVSHSS